MLDINHLAPKHTLIRTQNIGYDRVIILAESPHHYVTWIEGWYGTITGHYFMKSNGIDNTEDAKLLALAKAEKDFEERVKVGY